MLKNVEEELPIDYYKKIKDYADMLSNKSFDNTSSLYDILSFRLFNLVVNLYNEKYFSNVYHLSVEDIDFILDYDVDLHRIFKDIRDNNLELG